MVLVARYEYDLQNNNCKLEFKQGSNYITQFSYNHLTEQFIAEERQQTIIFTQNELKAALKAFLEWLQGIMTKFNISQETIYYIPDFEYSQSISELKMEISLNNYTYESSFDKTTKIFTINPRDEFVLNFQQFQLFVWSYINFYLLSKQIDGYIFNYNAFINIANLLLQ
jgi:hypothetical protein